MSFGGRSIAKMSTVLNVSLFSSGKSVIFKTVYRDYLCGYVSSW